MVSLFLSFHGLPLAEKATHTYTFFIMHFSWPVVQAISTSFTGKRMVFANSRFYQDKIGDLPHHKILHRITAISADYIRLSAVTTNYKRLKVDILAVTRYNLL